MSGRLRGAGQPAVARTWPPSQHPVKPQVKHQFEELAKRQVSRPGGPTSRAWYFAVRKAVPCVGPEVSRWRSLCWLSSGRHEVGVQKEQPPVCLRRQPGVAGHLELNSAGHTAWPSELVAGRSATGGTAAGVNRGGTVRAGDGADGTSRGSTGGSGRGGGTSGHHRGTANRSRSGAGGGHGGGTAVAEAIHQAMVSASTGGSGAVRVNRGGGTSGDGHGSGAARGSTPVVGGGTGRAAARSASQSALLEQPAQPAAGVAPVTVAALLAALGPNFLALDPLAAARSRGTVRRSRGTAAGGRRSRTAVAGERFRNARTHEQNGDREGSPLHVWYYSWKGTSGTETVANPKVSGGVTTATTSCRAEGCFDLLLSETHTRNFVLRAVGPSCESPFFPGCLRPRTGCTDLAIRNGVGE